MNDPVVLYNNKKMIVTHPSGHVDEYTAGDLIEQASSIQEMLNDLNEQKIDLDLKINSVQTS